MNRQYRDIIENGQFCPFFIYFKKFMCYNWKCDIIEYFFMPFPGTFFIWQKCGQTWKRYILLCRSNLEAHIFIAASKAAIFNL